ncbi:PD-(D/E)XK nuclease family transposase [Desulfofundulus sp. TPOSR]|uniref:PD-(D/E)XK nuclease family transposase n=1 Tax=Desulfofundulus sp. TPOSR TaxID=2714340 RepID=UPI00243359F7|nr:PD-(D/E)XK nuclease family transposase [Desulfofundulus sp. TPOSR]
MEAWLMYLNNLPGDELEAIPVEVPGLKKALTIEEIFKKSEKERRLYELREKAIRDEISMVAGAKAEGVRESIIRFVRKRFKSVSGELQAKIKQITDIEALERLYDELLDVETPEQAAEIVSRM